ncbi:DNA polymerase [Methylobacterium sp. Leaf104]|uniref:uracil-DNA glycosylase n=1 Tax=Methylobacterium TaxID=407 RepID=UPI0006F1E2F9|nr:MULTISPECIES: uracil-DNA glycosylase [Methylobacterium]KQP31816.1 DNA polymerase [Methylobacterium sp. Leaf104]MCI9880742.1 uracil-DNA glycosylase [Methylobacterium goesingense]
MSQGDDRQPDLIANLDFHVEAGLDLFLDEAPHDRFAEIDAPEPARAASSRPVLERQAPEGVRPPADETFRTELPPRGPAPPPARTYGQSASARPGEAAGDARARAKDVQTLEELEALLAGFDGCPLKFTAKNLVFADGNPAAKLMFIGEAPGADEDRVGKPFMGRSGKLLDRMMAAIGLDRSNAYVTNIVPWRPPGNRNPTPQEVSICKPFIERQIELADPDLIVCLGSPATQAITGTKDGILKARGRFYPYRVGNREIRALATLHPAYLLRQPLQKRLAWRDFRTLRAALDGKAGAV